MSDREADSGSFQGLMIAEELPPVLGARVAIVNGAVLNQGPEAACAELQRCFRVITWYTSKIAAEVAVRTSSEVIEVPDRDSSMSSLREALHKLLLSLGKLPEDHPIASHIFRIFYVGGLRAKDTSPRRHARLLDVGGKPIPGYKTLMDWCSTAPGTGDLKGEQRCQRELRRYLPIAKEWLNAAGKHFTHLPVVEVELASEETEVLANFVAEPAAAASPAKSSPKVEPPSKPSTLASKADEAKPATPKVEAAKTATAVKPVETQPEVTKAEAAAAEKAKAEAEAAEKAKAEAEAAEKAKAEAEAAEKAKAEAEAAEKAKAEAEAAEKAKAEAEAAEKAKAEAEAAEKAKAEAEAAEKAKAEAEAAEKAKAEAEAAEKAKAEAEAAEKTKAEAEAAEKAKAEAEAAEKAKAEAEAAEKAKAEAEAAEKAKAEAEDAEKAKAEAAEKAKAEAEAAEKAKAEAEAAEKAKAEAAEKVKAEAEAAEKAKAEAAEKVKAEAEAAEKAKAEAEDAEKAKAEAAEKAKAEAEDAEKAKAEAAEKAKAEAEAAEKAKAEAESAEKAEAEAAEKAKAETEAAEEANPEPAPEAQRELEAAEPASPEEEKPADTEAVKTAPKKSTGFKGQHVPSIFTEPLRRTLAAMQAKDGASARTELKGLARLILQYTFSAVAAALESYDCLPTLPAWKSPGSVEVLETKLVLLPDFVETMEELDEEERTLGKLLVIAKHTVSHIQEFRELGDLGTRSTPAKADAVAQGLALIRPWLEKALPFCNESEHYLEAPSGSDQVFGVIQFGEISLELEQPALRLYTELTSAPPAVPAPPETPAEAAAPPEAAPAEEAVPEADIDVEVDLAGRVAESSSPEFLKSVWEDEKDEASHILSTLLFLAQYFSGVLAFNLTSSDRELPADCQEFALPTSNLLDRVELLRRLLLAAPQASGTELDDVFFFEGKPLPHTLWLRGERSDLPKLSQYFSDAIRHGTPQPSNRLRLALDEWLESADIFFEVGEQLFEEANPIGLLEGVVIYKDRYLELVEPPLHTRFNAAEDAEFWALPSTVVASSGVSSPLQSQSLAAEPEPIAKSASALIEEPAAAPVAELAALPVVEAAEEAAEPLALEWPTLVDSAPPYLLECQERFAAADDHQGQTVACAEAISFLVQYFAGLIVAVGVQKIDLDASELDAYRADSSLTERLDMLKRVVADHLSSEQEPLPVLREIFYDGPQQRPFLQQFDHHNLTLLNQLRLNPSQVKANLDRPCLAGLSWLSRSQDLFKVSEHHCEPPSSKGLLDMVAQIGEDFFELVEPDYAIHLEPYAAEELPQDIEPPTIEPELVSPQAQEVGELGALSSAEDSMGAPSDEFFGALDSGESLLGAGSAGSQEIDDLFQVDPDQDWMAQLLAPTPEPAPPPPKKKAPNYYPKAKEVEKEPLLQETPAPVETAKDRYRKKMEEALANAPVPKDPAAETPAADSTAVAELLQAFLDKSDTPAVPEAAALSEAPAPATPTGGLVKADAVSKPSFVPKLPADDREHLAPCLEIEITIGEKQGNLNHGIITLRNLGGGVLKGTIKTLHPCIKVRPSVFRANDTEIAYMVDDNDKPASLKRMAISINHQGSKQEVDFEALLPAAKLKQLAGKVLDIVKRVREKKK